MAISSLVGTGCDSCGWLEKDCQAAAFPSNERLGMRRETSGSAGQRVINDPCHTAPLESAACPYGKYTKIQVFNKAMIHIGV